MCLRPLEIVTDRLVGYMFTYCTGEKDHGVISVFSSEII